MTKLHSHSHIQCQKRIIMSHSILFVSLFSTLDMHAQLFIWSIVVVCYLFYYHLTCTRISTLIEMTLCSAANTCVCVCVHVGVERMCQRKILIATNVCATLHRTVFRYILSPELNEWDGMEWNE